MLEILALNQSLLSCKTQSKLSATFFAIVHHLQPTRSKGTTTRFALTSLCAWEVN